MLLIYFFLSADIHVEPARIYGSTSGVTAGQDFELKCSTYGLTKAEEQVFVYLCKNGVGQDRVFTKSHDITFTVKSASLDHTGNYSCVFSRNKYSANAVRGEGDTPVFIKVIGECLNVYYTLGRGSLLFRCLLAYSS